MELPRVIASTNDLPEAVREVLADAYTEAPANSPEAGKLILKGVDPNVQRLQGALTNERGVAGERQQKIQELQSQLDYLAELSKQQPKQQPSSENADDGKRTTLKDLEAELEKRLGSVKTQYDQQIAAMEKKLADAEAAKTRAQEAQEMRDLEAKIDAIAVQKGASKETAPLVRRLVLDQIKKLPDVGFRVVDEQGNPVLGQSENQHLPMSFEEKTAEILSSNKFLLAGVTAGAGAGGSQEGSGNGSATYTGMPVTMTRAEANHPPTYRSKVAEAEKNNSEIVIVD